eukprot:1897296-Rhodomonas_salina.1
MRSRSLVWCGRECERQASVGGSCERDEARLREQRREGKRETDTGTAVWSGLNAAETGASGSVGCMLAAPTALESAPDNADAMTDLIRGVICGEREDEWGKTTPE